MDSKIRKLEREAAIGDEYAARRLNRLESKLNPYLPEVRRMWDEKQEEINRLIEIRQQRSANELERIMLAGIHCEMLERYFGSTRCIPLDRKPCLVADHQSACKSKQDCGIYKAIMELRGRNS